MIDIDAMQLIDRENKKEIRKSVYVSRKLNRTNYTRGKTKIRNISSELVKFARQTFTVRHPLR